MNIVDAALIIVLIIGALDGIKKGALGSIVGFIGSILVFVCAWQFKGILANYSITQLPQISNNPALSVIIYQILSFIVLIIVFSLIYKLLLKITNVVERIFDSTVILGFVSRTIGAVIGMIKYYIFLFLILFVLSIFNISYLNNSKVSNYILEKTPIFTPMIKNTWKSIKDVYESSSVEESLNALFDNGLITEENLDKLLGGLK